MKPSDQFSFIPPLDPLKIKWWWNFSHPFMYTDHLYDTQNSRAHLLFVPFFVLCCSRCSPFNIKYWITLCWPAGHLISPSVLYICETDDIINTTQNTMYILTDKTHWTRGRRWRKKPLRRLYLAWCSFILSFSIHCLCLFIVLCGLVKTRETILSVFAVSFFLLYIYILYVYARAWQNRREAVWVSTHSTWDINIIK